MASPASGFSSVSDALSSCTSERFDTHLTALLDDPARLCLSRHVLCVYCSAEAALSRRLQVSPRALSVYWSS